MQISMIEGHRGGLEVIEDLYPGIISDLTSSLAGIDLESTRTKVSNEKKTYGRLFYCPTSLNKKIRAALRPYGWRADPGLKGYAAQSLAVTQKIRLLAPQEQFDLITDSGEIPVLKQSKGDLIYQECLMEIQLGKYSFLARDLQRHECYYRSGVTQVGIELVPTSAMAKEMNTGVSTYTSLLHCFSEVNPPVPLILIGVNA